MDLNETPLCDEPRITELIADLARRIAEGRTPGAPLVMVGIKSRGEPIAHRIAAALGGEIPVGAVDITLYRDDLGKGDQWPVLKGTEIPFSIEAAEVILVDDVLYTGRTVRAALNCICDLGRPAAIRLAVLVDRGGHELPIRADYVGLELAIPKGDRVRVRIRPSDPIDQVVRFPSAPPRP